MEVTWPYQCNWSKDQKLVWKIFKFFLTFTENSMKPVTFSCRFKEGTWVKIVKSRMIRNERKKLK